MSDWPWVSRAKYRVLQGQLEAAEQHVKVLQQARDATKRAVVSGVVIAVDPTLPRGVAELRQGNRVVGRLVDLRHD